MTSVRIAPGRAAGTVLAPPSKSYTHRALVAAHLSGRTYRIVDPLDSEDTRATARAISALGTPVRRRKNIWTVTPQESEPAEALITIDCGESGTTWRFATALAARLGTRVALGGRGRLPARPMAELLSALRTLGADCRQDPARGVVTIRGPIHSGSVALDASRSSQFASALLFVLPTLDDGSVLRLTGPIVSGPYIEATVALLARHRVRVTREGRKFQVPGGQTYRGSRFRPTGDASSAAYLWTAAALTGGEVKVEGVDPDWPQADRAILPLLEQTGAGVIRARRSATVRGRALHPFRVDLSGAPDLYPLAGVLAASIPGRSEIRGAAHVELKESDRRAATADLARAFGARVSVFSDRMVIEGTSEPRAVHRTDLADHRLVMSAAVGALSAGTASTLGNARAVEKSFPGFWTALGELTGRHSS